MKFFVVIFVFCCGVVWSQESFDEKYTSSSNLGLTITNNGIIGNSFKGSYAKGFPSCEYPINSGIEHLFEGSLWIGGYKNGQPSVSTGSVDDATGYTTGKSGYEFTGAIGSKLNEKSSLIDSRNYNPTAISHQDFVSDFTDSNIVVPGTSIQILGHLNPLKVGVHFESYCWNYSFSDFFVILTYKITNQDNSDLDSAFIGLYADLVVRNTNITPAPGGTAFFNKGGHCYEDSLYMAYSFDASGDTAFTRSYVGLKFLGAELNGKFTHPQVNPKFNLNYHAWGYKDVAAPIFFSPSNDAQRYNKMAKGLNQELDWATVLKPSLKTSGNRLSFISIGPFTKIKPGESATISFAVVCAKMFEDGSPVYKDTEKQRLNLRTNAQWAQTAYDGEDKNFNGVLDIGEDKDGDGKITRYILPAPPSTPKTRYEVSENKIEIYWSDNAEASVDPITNIKDFEGYRIYKSRFGFDVQGSDALSTLNLVAEFDKKGDTIFYETGFEDIKLAQPYYFSDGDTIKYIYKYTLNNVQNGWQHVFTLTAFDKGDVKTNLESLETSRISNLKRIFPGTPANESITSNSSFVYPNPYYGAAQWEGTSRFQEDKKIIFANLPARCVIRIYTTSGDLVDELEHSTGYVGADARWFKTYGDPNNTIIAGGEHAWDMLSKQNQILARGIYLFSVKDLDSGKEYKGKFAIIK